jgi:hypothetical protein
MTYRHRVARTVTAMSLVLAGIGLMGFAPSAAGANEATDSGANVTVDDPGVMTLCVPWPPRDPGWFPIGEYWGFDYPDQACDECRADAAIWQQQGWQTWCWLVTFANTVLYVR